MSEHDIGRRGPISAGRNLPMALAVGALLGALVLGTLLTVPWTLLLVIAAVLGLATWELSRAMAARDVQLQVPPIAVGGAAILALAYQYGARDELAAIALTVIAVFGWRLPGGAAGYLRDVTASVFAVVYLPVLAAFVALMIAAPDGAHRALLFVILTVCSDTGGYFAGILLGRHPMAPGISPKKTWEGLAGSVILCLAAGAIGMTQLLPGQVWQGLILGVAAVGAATLGDLVESMIKRDLDIKDMSSILPGHGGILERLDSLLVVAPVAWLLMEIFLSAGH